jgi:hypothetical protein
VWSFAREPLDDSDIYHFGTLNARPWADKTLMKAVKAYNLSEADVMTLRAKFDDILGVEVADTVKVVEVFEYFVSCPLAMRHLVK